MYSVKELSNISGVTPRTIRYYDEINLLKPAKVNEEGYRFYTTKEVDLLQQILFYKNFGFSLESIKEILLAEDFSSINALKEHREKLIGEKDRLNILIDTLDKTILKEEGRKDMDDKEKFEGFKKQLLEENEKKYGTEIKSAFGEETVKNSNKKFLNLNRQEYQEMEVLGEEIRERLKNAVLRGIIPESQEGIEIAGIHKKWLMYTWNEYSERAHKNLTDMYLMDERFKSYYDKETEGCAQYLRDAVYYMYK